jgi:hypothetical protein
MHADQQRNALKSATPSNPSAMHMSKNYLVVVHISQAMLLAQLIILVEYRFYN